MMINSTVNKPGVRSHKVVPVEQTARYKVAKKHVDTVCTGHGLSEEQKLIAVMRVLGNPGSFVLPPVRLYFPELRTDQ